MFVLLTHIAAMTIPRHRQISLQHTPYYHCTSRCVRRAFLCGDDRYTGKNFDHRKQWLEDRLILLASIFAIDLLAYAIMSNHYHVVIRINSSVAASFSDEEVVERWRQLFTVPAVPAREHIERWRERLSDLSWYMRCLNEPLARSANREDDCTGRFWEGRFRCQALLDEVALLKCMTYVDLNPIRAAVAVSPETSAYTSIKARIEERDDHLLPLSDQTSTINHAVPIKWTEYLQLVEWSGRQVYSQKRGRIPEHLPTILERLSTSGSQWTDEMRHYGNWYYRAVGTFMSLERYRQHLGQHWLKGMRPALAAAA